MEEESASLLSEQTPGLLDTEALAQDQKALKKAEEDIDRLLRQAADFQNALKRAQNDVEQAKKFAIERFATDLLSVVDSLERGLVATPQTLDPVYAPLREGLEITFKQLNQVLEKFGVQSFEALEKPFDPQWHAALTLQATNVMPPNHVLSVIQKGYTLQGRLLRAAKVIVSQAEASAS